MTGMDEHDAGATDLTIIREAYTSAAAVYIQRFGSAGDGSEEDRTLIAGWARSLHGPVLDAGSGPGHWSAFLHELGVEVEGIDATPEFVRHATRSHPHLRFREGDLRRLDRAAGSLAGVLAWFSLIHLQPPEVREVLVRFADVLRPGGSLLIGYFSGTTLERFDHRVVTAWTWPPSDLAVAVEAAGFEVVGGTEEVQPSGRVFASLTARRSP